MQEWEAAGGLRLVKKAVSRFYLVDDSGYRTLTVVGEELPDGHYSYRSVPTFEQFEALDSRARRDVFTWLENIIQTSKASGGVAVLEPEDDPAADGAGVAGFDEHLLFVRYECASTTLPASKSAVTVCTIICFSCPRASKSFLQHQQCAHVWWQPICMHNNGIVLYRIASGVQTDTLSLQQTCIP